MRAFVQLHDMGRAVLLSVFLVTLMALFFLAIIRWLRLCRPLACIVPSLLLLLAGLDLLLLTERNSALYHGSVPTAAGHWAGSLPWALHALLLLVSGLYGARALLREKRMADQKITPDSIREALDNLPSGICFSRTSGIPLLTNRRMYALAQCLNGHCFRNAEEFWQKLAQSGPSNGIQRLQHGDSPVFRLPDGSVWRFARTRLVIGTEQYIQTTATNVTKFYVLSQELSENNAALREQQTRLKALLAQIVQIKREEEILASKVKLHDELGRCVLAGRRFFLHNDTGEEIGPVLALWRDTVEKLEISLSDTDKTETDPLGQLNDAAAALGCAIVFVGELPHDRGIAYLLLSAVREAVTNAVRHAGADRVTVRLAEKDGALAAQITDNGTGHPHSIVEGGGLLNLRRRLERAGGAIKILCEGCVQLHLRLPLTSKGESSWSTY